MIGVQSPHFVPNKNEMPYQGECKYNCTGLVTHRPVLKLNSRSQYGVPVRGRTGVKNGEEQNEKRKKIRMCLTCKLESLLGRICFVHSPVALTHY